MLRVRLMTAFRPDGPSLVHRRTRLGAWGPNNGGIMTLDRPRGAPSAAQLDSSSVIKRFDAPEHVLAFENGRFEVIAVGDHFIGKGSYGAGWRWSVAANSTSLGDRSLDHVGVVLSGRAKLAVGGKEFDLTPGDFFRVTSELDLWVIGARPCEVLYISGVEGLMNRFRRDKDEAWP